jgi:hypothetical protein
LAALVIVLALLAWAGTAPQVVGVADPERAYSRAELRAESERLQGSWEITSVLRDGGSDPSQVGGTLFFLGNSVAFVPKGTFQPPLLTDASVFLAPVPAEEQTTTPLPAALMAAAFS